MQFVLDAAKEFIRSGECGQSAKEGFSPLLSLEHFLQPRSAVAATLNMGVGGMGKARKSLRTLERGLIAFGPDLLPELVASIVHGLPQIMFVEDRGEFAIEGFMGPGETRLNSAEGDLQGLGDLLIGEAFEIA